MIDEEHILSNELVDSLNKELIKWNWGNKKIYIRIQIDRQVEWDRIGQSKQ